MTSFHRLNLLAIKYFLTDSGVSSRVKWRYSSLSSVYCGQVIGRGSGSLGFLWGKTILSYYIRISQDIQII